MEINENLKPFFWDINIDTLDREKHKQYIISRMFNFGDDQAIEWVRNEYTDAEIEEVARKSRNFTKKSAEFLKKDVLSSSPIVNLRTFQFLAF